MGGRFTEILDAKQSLEHSLVGVTKERDTLAQRLHESIKQLHSLKCGEVSRLNSVVAKLQASRQAILDENKTLRSIQLHQSGE
jgi:hypothetical protein